ncbi:response regulator [Leptospira noguchii]|uniref:Response regulator receiver domain protein n=3 Tax=Leptospira noguchii TaxID=28182 RepID=M6UPS5_9LEPT|nr:response regulator [Leptospira noguchii]EKR74375.1 response regulator receiver domain protein [Leptospira noguchii str. 2006001870]EMN00860.1 response regulator receiver domain protein [Leptospira noguchii str. 2007001578]EMO43024.1 response regulator receiver domain protein [Leptospira noguchii serovar Autumnalis str. ZUN142]EMS86009.1 response regulator receiver domain protein [Leptospira noguchii str. Hook]EPE84809.1 response regulator receiver domain protein [Leptospira noguchii str. 19
MKNKKLKCILLIDDNQDDNFFHERVIYKGNYAEKVIAKQSGQEALLFLKNKSKNIEPFPNLIFLDINMPGMNGWEFLEEYKKLDQELQTSTLIIMLTTSDNPDDKNKFSQFGSSSDFKTKPLTNTMIDEILERYFPESVSEDS